MSRRCWRGWICFRPDSPYEAGAVLAVRVAGHDEAFALTRLAFDGGELLVPRLDRALGERLRIRVRARDVMLASIRARWAQRAERAAGGGRRGAAWRTPATPTCGSASDRRGWSARVTRLSAHRLGLAAGRRIFAVVKSVAIDGRSRAAVRRSARAAQLKNDDPRHRSARGRVRPVHGRLLPLMQRAYAA